MEGWGDTVFWIPLSKRMVGSVLSSSLLLLHFSPLDCEFRETTEKKFWQMFMAVVAAHVPVGHRNEKGPKLKCFFVKVGMFFSLCMLSVKQIDIIFK